MKSLDAQFFGLTVDAFTTGALRVDGLIERSLSIERDAHQPSWLDVDVLDTAVFAELRVIAAGTGLWRGKEQGAAVQRCLVAVGMPKAVHRVIAILLLSKETTICKEKSQEFSTDISLGKLLGIFPFFEVPP